MQEQQQIVKRRAPAVFVHGGCLNKMPQTPWFEPWRLICSQFRRLQLEFHHGQALVRARSCLRGRLTSRHVLTGWGESPVVTFSHSKNTSFVRPGLHSLGLHLTLTISLKALPLMQSHGPCSGREGIGEIGLEHNCLRETQFSQSRHLLLGLWVSVDGWPKGITSLWLLSAHSPLQAEQCSGQSIDDNEHSCERTETRQETNWFKKKTKH